jgi:hypothetical protein
MHDRNKSLHPGRNPLPDAWVLYVCQMRPSRNKARDAAVFEILSLLAHYRPVPVLSGPLGSQKGVFWLGIAPEYQDAVEKQLRYLGYTSQVFRVGAPDDNYEGEPVRWHNRDYALHPVYQEDAAWMRERAPDRRVFRLRNQDGALYPVQGYRGDGTAMGRRGLAVEDARLLVNLAAPYQAAPFKFLDPFGGIGGLVVEALERGLSVYSGDVDPVVKDGIRHFGSHHSVFDAAKLPFAPNSLDGIASEPPFHEDARAVTESLMPEIWRVLKPGGRAALMVADWQIEILAASAARCGFAHLLTSAILRKGTDVTVCAWQKPAL